MQRRGGGIMNGPRNAWTATMCRTRLSSGRAWPSRTASCPRATTRASVSLVCGTFSKEREQARIILPVTWVCIYLQSRGRLYCQSRGCILSGFNTRCAECAPRRTEHGLCGPRRALPQRIAPRYLVVPTFDTIHTRVTRKIILARENFTSLKLQDILEEARAG